MQECKILEDARWLAKQKGLPKAEVRCCYECKPADGVCYMGFMLSETDLATSGAEQVRSFYRTLEATANLQATTGV